MRPHGATGVRILLSATKPITVVVSRFDDLLQGGLRALLDRDESIETVASAIGPDRLSVVLEGHRPDVAIVDVGGLGKLVEVQRLSSRHPHTSLVMLANRPSAGECAQLIAFGASSCLDTGAQARDVLSAIHLASRGLRLTPRGEAETNATGGRDSALLTKRESEVLPLLRDGRSNAEIALALSVGVETVRTHTRNIYRKLGVSSRRDLVAPARAASVRQPQPPARTRPRRPATLTSDRARRHG
jgi:DNA-binding NarL/FixJ family response regulator